jgi:hypothetical protein
MTQYELFGGDLEPEDPPRLGKQLRAIQEIMSDGEWRTFKDIQFILAAEYDISADTPGISARLRDFRKPQFGGHDLQKYKIAKGLWKYRVVLARQLGRS